MKILHTRTFFVMYAMCTCQLIQLIPVCKNFNTKGTFQNFTLFYGIVHFLDTSRSVMRLLIHWNCLTITLRRSSHVKLCVFLHYVSVWVMVLQWVIVWVRVITEYQRNVYFYSWKLMFCNKCNKMSILYAISYILLKKTKNSQKCSICHWKCNICWFV